MNIFYLRAENQVRDNVFYFRRDDSYCRMNVELTEFIGGFPLLMDRLLVKNC